MIKRKIIGFLICIVCIGTTFFPYISARYEITTASEMKDISLLHSNQKFNIQFNPEVRNVIIELDTTGIAYGHELLWKANTTGTNYEESAVTYLDGVAYIGSCSTHGDGHDKIFAVNTTNGEILWSYYTGPGYVGPVIDGDVVYIGSDSHGTDPTNEHMYAINRHTGIEIWNRSIYGGIPESVQYDDKKIYFCSDIVYALNKEDGSINWTYNLDSSCVTKPMLKDNVYFTASSAGTLYKIDAEKGSRIWSVYLPAGPWDNSITADNEGHIFLGIYWDKTMNAYHEHDGSLIWSYKLRGGPLSFNAYHDGVVFIADTHGYVYALDSADGTLIWDRKIGYTIDISSPTLSNNLLFIGTRDWGDDPVYTTNGAFYVLNETTGDIIWKYHVGSSVTAPPSIADGMMFCGTDGWDMYAFDFGIGNGDWVLHRYDKYNTAYSPEGITTWQYVKAECTTDNDITTCIVSNYYDHDVVNVDLRLNSTIKRYWYDSSGILLTSDSDHYVLDRLSSLSSMTGIISETELHPPDKPVPPSGPASGKINTVYTCNTSTTDPDGDQLYYLFDWGDGTDSSWLGPYVSGDTIESSHRWTTRGSYEIRVKAKDTLGFESEWSDPLPITMPYLKTRNPFFIFLFERLVERFPFLWNIIKKI